MQYTWLKNVADISSDHESIHFYSIFNQEMEPNTFPENLITLIFGYHFNQKSAF